MVALTAPNGVTVNVPEGAVERLVAHGYAVQAKPKAAPRRRKAAPKTKE